MSSKTCYDINDMIYKTKKQSIIEEVLQDNGFVEENPRLWVDEFDVEFHVSDDDNTGFLCYFNEVADNVTYQCETEWLDINDDVNVFKKVFDTTYLEFQDIL